MIHFYHRFIEGAAQTLQPLFAALSGKPRVLEWTDSMKLAFISAKQPLSEATMLIFPDSNAKHTLSVDASDVAVGGVLEQFSNGVWQPLAFFSRQLRPPEKKYSAFDRELLALYLGVRHFRYFLEGRHFTMYTDHKPLTFAFAKVSDPWSARQQRHLAAISEYSTDIQHVAGKDNIVAGTLSRCNAIAAINHPVAGVDFSAMAEAQLLDEETPLCRTAISGLKLQDIPFGPASATLLCDISTGQPRPLVPQSCRRVVFEAIHNLAHPSVRATQKLLAQKFVWHGMRKQVGIWAHQCVACQASKIHQHTKAPLYTFEVPQRRFDHINIDLVGPLPPSKGYTYLLTIVDRFTRWPEAIPMTHTDSESCAWALISNWIARFGLPSGITSYHGPQFTSVVWAEVIRLLGISHHLTTAYHPQVNGLVERFHRHLKSVLRARLAGPNWADVLPWVLLGIRTTPKEDLKASSAELVYGAPLTVPGDFVALTYLLLEPSIALTQIREQVRNLKPIPTSQHGHPRAVVPRSLAQSQFVFLRRDPHRSPLQRPYEGPFRVLLHGEKTFTLDIGGRSEVITIDRLKPAHLDIDRPIPLAQPPR